MKICYFDAFSGISGDMTVGALLDAGADWKRLHDALQSLNLPAQFRVEKAKRRGIAASKFYVDAHDEKKHRHLPHIEKIILAGALSEKTKSSALKIFGKLAEAESQSHDVAIEKVHFHEVGAVDSICDIVGACAGLDFLGVEQIHCSRINVGSGTVETEHGTLPVPAPATANLLHDRPIYSAGPEAELTTPTGAAIVSSLATNFGGPPAMRILAQGFGAGDKDFPGRANVLRVLIGESAAAMEATSVQVIEANVDDSTPQVLGYAMERLLGAGALDVTLTPVSMKKNRPGMMISVIARADETEALTAILFAETSTLGVRIVDAQRRVLARQSEEVETPHGKVRVKFTDGGAFAPEYEDCRRIAIERSLPLRLVMAEATEAFRQKVKA